MPTLLCVLLALLMVTATGCKKDEVVHTTTAEIHALAAELTQKVNSATDKKAGVAEAQTVLDARSTAVAEHMARVLELRGFQVSEDAMAEMAKSTAGDLRSMQALKRDLVSEAVKDPELLAALDKLIADFTELARPSPPRS